MSRTSDASCSTRTTPAPIDVVTLRREQERINGDARTLQERLSQADASLDEWQAVLDIAIRFAADCTAAYRRANEKTRALFNRALFEQLLVRDGRIAEARYLAPFDLLFNAQEFEYHDLVEAAGVEPASEAAYRTTSTSVVPVLFSPIRRPGTRL